MHIFKILLYLNSLFFQLSLLERPKSSPKVHFYNIHFNTLCIHMSERTKIIESCFIHLRRICRISNQPCHCLTGRKSATPPSSTGCIYLHLPVQRSASCVLELWGLDTPLQSRAPPQRKVWIPFPLSISAVLCGQEKRFLGVLMYYYVFFCCA